MGNKLHTSKTVQLNYSIKDCYDAKGRHKTTLAEGMALVYHPTRLEAKMQTLQQKALLKYLEEGVQLTKKNEPLEVPWIARGFIAFVNVLEGNKYETTDPEEIDAIKQYAIKYGCESFFPQYFAVKCTITRKDGKKEEILPQAL